MFVVKMMVVIIPFLPSLAVGGMYADPIKQSPACGVPPGLMLNVSKDEMLP